MAAQIGELLRKLFSDVGGKRASFPRKKLAWSGSLLAL
jgi:hypothetical protein